MLNPPLREMVVDTAKALTEPNAIELKALHAELKTTNNLLRRWIATQAFWRSFLHGLIAGLGGTIGLAVVLWLVYAGLRSLQLLPGIGNEVQQILPIIQRSARP